MQNYKKVYKHTLQVNQNIYKRIEPAEQAESVVQAGLNKAAHNDYSKDLGGWYDEVKYPGFDSQNIKPYV